MGVQQALCSSRALPFPVFVNLAFRDVRWPLSRRVKLHSTRVAASRGRKAVRQGKRRILLSTNSSICRANSFDHQQAGEAESEVEEDESHAGRMKEGTVITLQDPVRDAFRSAPPRELIEDEFFARMSMALEAAASRHSCSRASSTSPAAFFDGSSLHAACEPPHPSPGHNVEPPLCALRDCGTVQLPSSIKKLRRRKGDAARAVTVRGHGSQCAIKRAFSSMVYMIKAVQSHALRIRQVMFADEGSGDVHEVLHRVHREMHSSFVWLFQRVFACTPKLMVRVMILLANFTVFSMGENLVGIAADTPPAISRFHDTAPGTTHGNSQLSTSSPEPTTSNPSNSPEPTAGSGGINFRFPDALIADGFDDDSWLKVTVKEEQVQLAREITTRKLVGPHLESDNYGCFDRTDLDYQLAIAKHPQSPVLLANYAQFLFVVRRDPNRAEEYFHRALEAYPRDGTTLDRFARFLWLGRGDGRAAERVYKAAMAADPDSSYSAGSYAHFLWHHAGTDVDTGHGRIT